MSWRARRAGRTSERGVIILVYATVMALVVVTAAVSAAAFTEQRLAQRTYHQTQAFYVAEAGLDNALVAFRANPDYAGTGYVPVGNAIGGYDVTVVDLGNDQRQITVLGHYPDNNPASAWYSASTVQVVATVKEQPLFSAAAFGNHDVLGLADFATADHHRVVDSYDSRLGRYQNQTPGSHGTLGSNGNGNDTGLPVVLGGYLEVHGDILVAPGAQDPGAVNAEPPASVSGNLVVMEKPRELDPVTIPEGLVNQGELSVAGTVVLPGGTYWYDSVLVEGPQSHLVCTGPVTLYTSSFRIGSMTNLGVSTFQDLPSNLVVYVDGPGGGAEIMGHADFYGAVYAPETSIYVNVSPFDLINAVVHHAQAVPEISVYGSLVGSSVIFFMTSLHYDEALSEVGGHGATVDVDLWGNP